MIAEWPIKENQFSDHIIYIQAEKVYWRLNRFLIVLYVSFLVYHKPLCSLLSVYVSMHHSVRNLGLILYVGRTSEQN